MSPNTAPLHGLAPEIIEMIRGQLEAAIATLKGLPVADDARSDDARRVTAVMVMLEQVIPEFVGQGLKPWRAVPWLDCAGHLLQDMPSAATKTAREHVSAARELLVRE